MCKETSIIKICNFLNVHRETFVKHFNQKTVDKIVQLWDDGQEMKVHSYGYEFIKDGYHLPE